MESFISILLAIFAIYLLLGVIFAILFLFRGITKVDPATKGSGFFFKLLIFPGLVFFWLFLLSKWIKTNRS